jgi:hypothetical protein
MEPKKLSPDALLRYLLENSLENGAFALEEYFTPMLDYILADESWKQAIPCTFDTRSLLYLVFYASSVVGFYFLLASTSVINRFLPKKVKSVK